MTDPTATEPTTPRKSFVEMQRDAAMEQAREQAAEHRRISDLVLGDRPGRRYVTEVIKLGNDHLVAVKEGNDDTPPAWTFVIDGKRSNNYYPGDQDSALLHLIASRYDSNVNSSYSSAFYAGRVIGLPEAKD
ncbi:hypothetical protein JNW90_24195 [Micromonospora sp. STR1s_5]|nr:hypothetical protein [Micromonospora sp. STR1s_5]